MGYDARKREILESLFKVNYDQAAKDEITRIVDAYMVQREGRLDNLLQLLNPSEDNIHQQWLDKCKEAAAGASEALTKKGFIELGRISNEEHTFFFKLMICHVPSKRDLMVQQTKALKNAEKEFETKWNAIKDADNSIEGRMKQLAQDMEKILNEAASFAAKAEAESKEALRQKIKLAMKVFDFGIVETVVKNAIRFYELKRNEVQERKYEIQALMTREMGVFTTFKEGREMVKKFLDETSYPRVKDAYDGLEQAANKLGSDMITPAQNTDAAAFGNALKDKGKAVFSKAEEAYKEFARKHEGLFFGPLGGGFHQELMEGDFWKTFSDKWKNSKRDIDDVLRERYFSVSDDQMMEISLAEDGLTGDVKKQIREKLETNLRDLLRAWNQFKEFCYKDPEWALQSREQLKSLLDNFR